MIRNIVGFTRRDCHIARIVSPNFLFVMRIKEFDNRVGKMNTMRVQTKKGTFFFTSKKDIEQFFGCSFERVNKTNPIEIEFDMVLLPYVNINRRGKTYYNIENKQ